MDSFDFSTALYILLVCSNIAFVVAALAKRRRSIASYLFVCINIAALGWIMTLYLIYHGATQENVLFVGRLNFTSIVFSSFFILLFSYFFPTPVGKVNRPLIGALVLETVVLAGITQFTGLIDAQEILTNGKEETIFGPLYILFAAHFLVYMAGSVALLLYKRKKFTGTKKLQIYYVLLGVVLSHVFGFVTNIYLPFALNDYSLQSLGPIALVLFNVCIFYTIVRYRFMDIRIVVRKVLVYGIQTVFAYGVFYFITGLLSYAFGGIYSVQSYAIGVLIALWFVGVFNMIGRLMKNFSNHYVFPSLYNYREAIQQISDQLTYAVDINKVYQSVSEGVKAAVNPEIFGLLLFEEMNQKIMVFGLEQEFASRIMKDDLLRKALVKSRDPIVTEEIVEESEEANALKADLNEYKIAIVGRLVSSNKLIGMLVLGNKSDQSAYSTQDLELIKTIAQQSSLALDNALLYQKVNQMNATLQEKVAAQTKDIVEKTEHLKKLLDMRSEFLDVTSHQLRTPVSVIKGTLSLMREQNFHTLPHDQQLEFINSIYHKSEKLESIISDILSASEMDSDKFIIQLKDRVNMSEILEDVIEDFAPQAREKNIDLRFARSAQPLPLIKGSKRYLEHAINNLVSNALRYTKKGSITLSAELVSAPETTIVIKVADTGIGIPAAALPKLFEKFVRAQNARDMYTDGSGLGLFIVKKSVHAHPGARVWAESEGEGKGSTFIISLPVISEK